MASEDLKKKLIKARDEISGIESSELDNMYGFKDDCLQDVDQVTEAFENNDDLSDDDLISCVEALIALFSIRAEILSDRPDDIDADSLETFTEIQGALKGIGANVSVMRTYLRIGEILNNVIFEGTIEDRGSFDECGKDDIMVNGSADYGFDPFVKYGCTVKDTLVLSSILGLLDEFDYVVEQA